MIADTQIDDIIDQDQDEEEVAPVQYDIASYGADYDVDGLVKRLKRGDIFTPEFHREFVWKQAEASRLIESLLLGLPIPGIFLAREVESNKLLIIDGQQRLKSLLFFYQGFFDPKEEQKTKRIFKLINVQEKFLGKTYETLDDDSRIRLNDSIIHATIIKQESPKEDSTAIYHVFERLNAGGKKLTPQEIRTAIYYGSLNNMIHELNEFGDWRELFGPRSARLKDQELILRFFASYHRQDQYSKPMSEFLNKFNINKRNPSQEFLQQSTTLFKKVISFIKDNIGKRAFRPEGVLNVSVFEAITVGLAKVLKEKGYDYKIDEQIFIKTNQELLKNTKFLEVTSRATSDESVFRERHQIVDQYFAVL